MTEAQRRLNTAVSYVKARWGKGWPRLTSEHQQALVRAEVLRDIWTGTSVNRDKIDPIDYVALVSTTIDAAIAWNPDGDE